MIASPKSITTPTRILFSSFISTEHNQRQESILVQGKKITIPDSWKNIWISSNLGEQSYDWFWPYWWWPIQKPLCLVRLHVLIFSQLGTNFYSYYYAADRPYCVRYRNRSLVQPKVRRLFIFPIRNDCLGLKWNSSVTVWLSIGNISMDNLWTKIVSNSSSTASTYTKPK